MESQSGYLPAADGWLHYLKWGTGPRLLLAFHGYGDHATVFNPLREYLETAYTIMSFDLPYHGESIWPSGRKLTAAIMAQLTTEAMADCKVTKVSLMGYSLGGRVCLAITELLPHAIEQVTLLAPDGLTIDPYYSFFTGTAMGKWVFRNMLEHPAPYFYAMDLMRKMNLVHPSRHKFAMHFLHAEDSRSLLLHVWPVMSGVSPNTGRLRKEISRHGISIALFMGANDKIMPPARGRKFQNGLDTVQLHILDRGHLVLDHDTARQIAASLI